MKLSDWMQKTETSAAALADAIGASDQAIYKYIGGERIPRPDVMKKISSFTGGLVTANDFYEV